MLLSIKSKKSFHYVLFYLDYDIRFFEFWVSLQILLKDWNNFPKVLYK